MLISFDLALSDETRLHLLREPIEFAFDIDGCQVVQFLSKRAVAITGSPKISSHLERGQLKGFTGKFGDIRAQKV